MTRGRLSGGASVQRTVTGISPAAMTGSLEPSSGTLRYYDIIDIYDIIIVNYFDIIVYQIQYHMYDIIDMILHMIS
jgi:hypothetical protein